MINRDDNIENEVEKADDAIDEFVNGVQSLIENARIKIQEKITPVVREMLVVNYNRSGIKTNTGKLLGALKNAEVFVQFDAKKPKIVIRMPAGIDDYEEGSNFYEVASSLNYGAMHSNIESGQKKKKTIKKAVLRNSNKKKPSNTIIAGGHVLGVSSGKNSIGIGGGDYVTKPYDFWSLTKQQEQTIMDIALEIFNKEVYGGV